MATESFIDAKGYPNPPSSNISSYLNNPAVSFQVSFGPTSIPASPRTLLTKCFLSLSCHSLKVPKLGFSTWGLWNVMLDSYCAVGTLLPSLIRKDLIRRIEGDSPCIVYLLSIRLKVYVLKFNIWVPELTRDRYVCLLLAYFVGNWTGSRRDGY